jgi:hypothetical protein
LLTGRLILSSSCLVVRSFTCGSGPTRSDVPEVLPTSLAAATRLRP